MVLVLGSFQCRGVLLLLHIAGQGPSVLAAGAGRVDYIYIYIYIYIYLYIIIIIIIFICLPFLMSFLLGDG